MSRKIKHDEEDEPKGDNYCQKCYGNVVGWFNGEEYESCPFCEYKDNDLPDGFIEGSIYDLDEE